MGENMVGCPRCNGSLGVKTIGHLETVYCVACGWSQLSTVYPDSNIELTDKSVELVIVHINWSSRSELGKEVVQARQLFDQLSAIPLQELMQQAKGSCAFRLGIYSRSVAVDMQERAKAKGIKLSFKKVADLND